jgi:Histidine kinase-, DNA gyrase B-, and HSP90-like ATPase
MNTKTIGNIQLLEVLPDPVSLIESMRAVGYTVEAAVADIVDNSISADAKNITIEYDASDNPYVAILDDGEGMTPAELTEAMRHGRNPSDTRDPKDLGRFGLGLKTASLSQCRRLTVVSVKEGVISARAWDLDVVQDTEKWVIVIPSKNEIQELPLSTQLSQFQSGTLVVWQQLDRLIAGSNRPQAEMTLKFHAMESHLALVFHRFKQREGNNPAVNIELNGRPLPARDPFLKSNNFKQPLEGQTIKHTKGNVFVTPYILPPISHLSPEEIELAGGMEGLKNSQGFYIYRARRLVIWGTWFRLVPKEEFYKLSRVQVDIPNSFDELWSLDIKKSAAFPPDIIRNRLKEITPHFVNKSKLTVTYKGRKNATVGNSPIWMRIEPKHNAFHYSLNREHPLLANFSTMLGKDELKKFEFFLNMVEKTIPFESIYADMCNDKREESAPKFEECLQYATQLINILGLPIETVIEMDPLDKYPQYHLKLKEELKK